MIRAASGKPVTAPWPHPSGARKPEIPAELVPEHVAIVMDGNGRWANQRGLPRVEGHKAGEPALLDVVAGRLAPTSGTVNRPRSLRIGHLGQDDEPVPSRTVGAHLRAAAGSDGEEVPELFGLVHPRDLARPFRTLSRGQLRRVMLAAVLLDPPELLILDEPTNHLALVTATRLEAALADWPGTVLLASHDRWLRSRWEGEVLELTDTDVHTSRSGAALRTG